MSISCDGNEQKENEREDVEKRGKRGEGFPPPPPYARNGKLFVSRERGWRASPRDEKVFFSVVRQRKRERGGGKDGRLFFCPLPISSSCMHTHA